MLVNILEFLTSQKTIILGSVACICEALVVIINTCRQLNVAKNDVKPLGVVKKKPFSKILFWSLNPVNLFRKIK